MQVLEFSPNKKLKAIIYSYYFIRKNQFKHENIPPLGMPVLQFHLKNNIENYFQNYNIEHSEVMLIGQLTHYAQLIVKGEFEMIGVNFHETAISKFSNIKMKEITDSAIPAHIVFGIEINNLMHKLQNNSPEKCVVTLDDYFLQLISNIKLEKDRLDRLIDHIRFENGNISVKEMCNYIATSERTLERIFKSKIGISPKQYCIVIRHLNLLKYIELKQSIKLDDILHECGYIDQSHFDKEFKKVSGIKPSQFFNSDQQFTNLLVQL